MCSITSLETTRSNSPSLSSRSINASTNSTFGYARRAIAIPLGDASTPVIWYPSSASRPVICPFPHPRSQIVLTPSSVFTSSTKTRVSFSPDSPLPALSARHSNSVYVDTVIQISQLARRILPRILLRQLQSGTTASREFVSIRKRLGQLLFERTLIDRRDPPRISRRDLSSKIHIRTDHHRHRLRQRFHHTQSEVFLVRRQGQQRRATQHCVFLVTIEPARERYSLVRSGPGFEHRHIINWPVTSKHQSPSRKLRLLHERQKRVYQNIESLLRMQTRQYEHVRILSRFAVRVAGDDFNTQRDHPSVIQTET